MEGHADAFDWFDGVFAEVRYDNLTSAVKQVLKGRRRVESDRFVALRSHYLYESVFTTPGIAARTRRAVSRARSAGCDATTWSRSLRWGRSPSSTRCCWMPANTTWGGGSPGGRAPSRSSTPSSVRCCAPLPAEPFDATETATVRVDATALVCVRQNRYSVPVALAGLRVAAQVGAQEIVISHRGDEVARHERLHGRFATSAKLDHYLELLARKPGRLERSLALSQEGERGAWPDCFDELWRALVERYGASEAARQMVDVLLLVREHGPARVELAVRGTLAAGAVDGRAVAVLARRTEAPARPPAQPAMSAATPGRRRWMR